MQATASATRDQEPGVAAPDQLQLRRAETAASHEHPRAAHGGVATDPRAQAGVACGERFIDGDRHAVLGECGTSGDLRIRALGQRDREDADLGILGYLPGHLERDRAAGPDAQEGVAQRPSKARPPGDRPRPRIATVVEGRDNGEVRRGCPLDDRLSHLLAVGMPGAKLIICRQFGAVRSLPARG